MPLSLIRRLAGQAILLFIYWLLPAAIGIPLTLEDFDAIGSKGAFVVEPETIGQIPDGRFLFTPAGYR